MKVYVDAQPKEILRADYNLRGVIVPAGEHLVEFVYDLLSFKLGLAISLLTIVGLLGSVFVIANFNSRSFGAQ